MSDGTQEFFVCKECGGKELFVVREYSQTTQTVRNLPCRCEEGLGDLAARQTVSVTRFHRQTGPLDDDHSRRLGEESSELDIAPPEQDDVDEEVYCPRCHAEAGPDDWEVEEEETGEGDAEYYVRCCDCGREIEFGWSHQDRGGRIWPVETADFNPWKSWPERRYIDHWREEGWLRPFEPDKAARILGLPEDEVRALIERGELPKHPKAKGLATDSFAVADYLREGNKGGQSFVE